MLELDGLVAVLNGLRGVMGSTPTVVELLTKADLLSKYPLAARIEEFVTSPTHHKLRICIRYRDCSLFLEKRADGVELNLSKHPLGSVDENARLDRLMGERGVHPTTDYLSDSGRTRILHYRLPAVAQSIADLCGEILAGVYQVEAADEVLICQ